MMTKAEVLKTLEQLPDDATINDMMERLYVLYKIEQGLFQLDAGEGVPHEEVRQRVAKWQR